MSQINLLYRLQQTDSSLLAGKRRLHKIVKAQEEPASLQQAKATAEQTATAVQQFRKQQKSQELELGSLTSKIESSEARLYSGNIKTTKELADLQTAIESLKRRHAQLEETLLETMMGLEEAEETDGAARATHAEVGAAWQASSAELKVEQMELVAKVNELTKLRQEQVAHIDRDVLQDYEIIRRKKGGVAVVEMKQGRCQGCQVGLSASKQQRLRQGHIEHCSSCGRILYAI